MLPAGTGCRAAQERADDEIGSWRGLFQKRETPACRPIIDRGGGVVVAIVKLRIRPPSGKRQVSHNPAIAIQVNAL
jgi:hypothetical protein